MISTLLNIFEWISKIRSRDGDDPDIALLKSYQRHFFNGIILAVIGAGGALLFWLLEPNDSTVPVIAQACVLLGYGQLLGLIVFTGGLLWSLMGLLLWQRHANRIY